MLNFEVLEFLVETYWSKDYIVEQDGKRKLAKFVKEGLITRPEEAVLKSELAKNIQGIIVPESFVFEKSTILIYDIDNIKYYSKFDEEMKKLVSLFLLNVVRNILHIPKLYVPVLGFMDIVKVGTDILLFLPFVQDYKKLIDLNVQEKEIQYFIAPEVIQNSLVIDSSTIYVFGKVIETVTEDKTIKELSFEMTKEEPSLRKIKEDIPYFTISRKKRTLALKRIVRDEESEILKFIEDESADGNFLGVVGSQRIGKTTIIENIENTLREKGIPFLHAMSGSDIIAQTLQLVSDIIPSELLNELSKCIEKTCKIDTISIAVVQALENLNKVVIFVDDYHEVHETLKSFLKKISDLSKSKKIKIIAFSVEDFEEFEKRIYISPFTVEQVKNLLEVSFNTVHEINILSNWLTIVSNGLPGVVVEYLRYLYENDVLYFKGNELMYDLDKLAEIEMKDVFEKKIESLSNEERYIAILGQKFTKDEIKMLSDKIGKEIDISKLVSEGIIYKEYDKYRFTLRQYWELLYNSISLQKRIEFHKFFAEKSNDIFKKAWHLEMVGNKISAATVYLKYIGELLNYYASPSLVKSVIRKVKEIIGNRISYALIKFEVELLTRTEEMKELESLSIPERKLYSYHLAKMFFFSYNEKRTYEILKKFPNAYGKIGELRKKLLFLRAEYEITKKRGDYFQKVTAIISELKEDNPIHADILTDAYFFAARVLSDNPQKALQFLKKAEAIALNYNFAHKLPSIYNNMAIESSNMHISMAYLKRSVEVANDIGLPAKGYLAQLNILYHQLYAGKINDFINGISSIKPRIELLGLTHEIVYANSLEAYYHAYNFEIEEALEHISEIEKLTNETYDAEKIFFNFLVRNFESVKKLISEIEISKLDEENLNVLEIIKKFESNEFGIMWEKYINRGGKVFREEICAVFGDKLAKLCPELFRKELEYLENKFTLDGSLLSLAMVYEGYGHYYKETGKIYKANVYYSKAITIYKDIGLIKAANSLSKMYDIFASTESLKEIEDTRALSLDVLTSLKVVDPKTDPQVLMDYFISKVLSVFPVKNVYFKIYDRVLDKTFESGIGDFKKYDMDYISVSPLEIYLSDNFDPKSRYEIYASNQDVSFSEDLKQKLISKMEIIEYGFVAVFKSFLTRMRSYVDPLTKLFTRYYFADLLSQYFENAVNQKDSLAIVMCDIDNFKRINDTYGHLTGDEVLKTIAKILRDNVRATDIVGRFGGEEFIMAFPSTDSDKIVLILERLRRLVKDIQEFPFKLTLSFGVVNYPHNTENIIIKSPEDLIRLADTALYHAKNTGKDKIVVYSEGMTGGLHA